MKTFYKNHITVNYSKPYTWRSAVGTLTIALDLFDGQNYRSIAVRPAGGRGRLVARVALQTAQNLLLNRLDPLIAFLYVHSLDDKKPHYRMPRVVQ